MPIRSTDEPYYLPYVPTCHCSECIAVNPEGRRAHILVRPIRTFNPSTPVEATSMHDLPDQGDIVCIPTAERLGQVIGFTDQGQHPSSQAHKVGILIAEWPAKHTDTPAWILFAGWLANGAPTTTDLGKKFQIALN